MAINPRSPMKRALLDTPLFFPQEGDPRVIDFTKCDVHTFEAHFDLQRIVMGGRWLVEPIRCIFVTNEALKKLRGAKVPEAVVAVLQGLIGKGSALEELEELLTKDLWRRYRETIIHCTDARTRVGWVKWTALAACKIEEDLRLIDLFMQSDLRCQGSDGKSLASFLKLRAQGKDKANVPPEIWALLGRRIESHAVIHTEETNLAGFLYPAWGAPLDTAWRVDCVPLPGALIAKKDLARPGLDLKECLSSIWNKPEQHRWFELSSLYRSEGRLWCDCRSGANLKVHRPPGPFLYPPERLPFGSRVDETLADPLAVLARALVGRAAEDGEFREEFEKGLCTVSREADQIWICHLRGAGNGTDWHVEALQCIRRAAMPNSPPMKVPDRLMIVFAEDKEKAGQLLRAAGVFANRTKFRDSTKRSKDLLQTLINPYQIRLKVGGLRSLNVAPIDYDRELPSIEGPELINDVDRNDASEIVRALWNREVHLPRDARPGEDIPEDGAKVVASVPGGKSFRVQFEVEDSFCFGQPGCETAWLAGWDFTVEAPSGANHGIWVYFPHPHWPMVVAAVENSQITAVTATPLSLS